MIRGGLICPFISAAGCILLTTWTNMNHLWDSIRGEMMLIIVILSTSLSIYNNKHLLTYLLLYLHINIRSLSEFSNTSTQSKCFGLKCHSFPSTAPALMLFSIMSCLMVNEQVCSLGPVLAVLTQLWFIQQSELVCFVLEKQSTNQSFVGWIKKDSSRRQSSDGLSCTGSS